MLFAERKNRDLVGGKAQQMKTLNHAGRQKGGRGDNGVGALCAQETDRAGKCSFLAHGGADDLLSGKRFTGLRMRAAESRHASVFTGKAFRAAEEKHRAEALLQKRGSKLAHGSLAVDGNKVCVQRFDAPVNHHDRAASGGKPVIIVFPCVRLARNKDQSADLLAGKALERCALKFGRIVGKGDVQEVIAVGKGFFNALKDLYIIRVVKVRQQDADLVVFLPAQVFCGSAGGIVQLLNGLLDPFRHCAADRLGGVQIVRNSRNGNACLLCNIAYGSHFYPPVL